jgi:SAM-dependent methyltransferase
MDSQTIYKKSGVSEPEWISRGEELKFKKVAQLIPEDSKILDIGCSYGKIVDFVGKRKKYVGIDFSQEKCMTIMRKGESSIITDVDKGLPFKDGSFSVVLLLDVIEHLISPFKIFEETNRVLEDGGLVIISLPNPLSIKMFITTFLSLPDYPKGPKDHLQAFTLVEIKNLFKYSGFELIKIRGIHMGLPMFPHNVNSFLGDIHPKISSALIYVGKKRSLHE